MEATVLSGPLGLTQAFPLGFQTLDPDNGAVLCPSQSGQTGLDFRNGDQQEQTPQPNLDKRVFVDKPEELDSLIDVSTFSYGDMQFKGELKELSCTEKINGLDEISDTTLSWLFSPNFPDVIGKNSACHEATFTQDPCHEATFTQDPCHEATFTQDPCNEATTLTQDPCNEATLTQDSCNEATFTQDPCNEATFTQDPCNEATLTQDPCNEATLTQDPCHEATLTQDPCNEATFTQDPCNEATLTQDPCNEATLTQDPCNEATLTQDPCHEATTLTQDPCHEATFTQDPCNEATLTQDPCNEATLTQDPCNEATLTQDPCNEVTLTQDPCHEATLTQDPCNEATLTQDPCHEATLTQDPSPEGPAVLISFSVPSSPVKISQKDSEINAGDVFLLDLFSNEQSPGEFNPHGVSEELGEEFGEERVGLPVTVSPETRDQGLFPDQVTHPPDSTTLQSLPENCLPHDHISSSLECSEGSVPLLDLKVPDIDSCLSLCPASPASVVCTGTLLDSPIEESEVLHAGATVITNPTSENQGENNSPSPGLSHELSSLTLPLAEDGLSPDGPTSESHSEEDVSKNLMEDIRDQESKDMALDLCLTVEEVHDEDPWDLKPQEESVPDPAAEGIEEKSSAETNQPEGPACHQVPSFEFSLHTSSSEAGWTSEQAVETISLSKMVVDDSLPMVSAASTREEDVSPLKAVFDALDQDGDGFVRIEEFMEFAAAYGADQVKDLTKFLDPSGLGVISFEDFHRGISAISNGGPEPQLYVGYSPGDGAVSCPEEYDEQNEVTDSAYLGSESTYSECETFTDEDTGALVPPEMHEDVETDSGIEATLHDPEDGGNRFSLNSEHHNHSLVAVLGGEEEHFEDFGESNTSELLLESSVEVAEGEGDTSVTKPLEEVDGSSLLSPSAAASLPDCFQSFLREEALDFFCSQCHKQISRLEDLSTRLNFLEMTSAGKRLSSKKVARHLLQNSSMTLDTMSDLTRDILELADNDITDKVLLLERRVAELEKESEASGEQHARLRQENLQLVHRANALEEQLKEQELLADEQIQQETRRHKEALSKLERERGMELENLQARLQQLDEENSELRSCVPCLRANIERLEEEKRKLQDEADSMSDRLQDETESRRKMADKLNHERHQSQKDKECTQELIEDLRKQLEHLQLYKLEAEAKRGRTPGAGLQEYQTRTREAELEQEIKRLKQDNRTLKDQNDELNGQIINLSIQGAKNLMSASFSDSLAAEINSVSRAELMEAVHKQEEINYRLQDYIDKIIVAIMECNPSILEVK